MTDDDLRPPGQRRNHAHPRQSGWGAKVLWMVLLAALAYGAWWGWQSRLHLQPPAQVQATAPPIDIPPIPAPQVHPLANGSPSTPQHPLDVADAATHEALNDTALQRMVRQWLGDQAMQWVVGAGLAQHVVATVDNLPRSHAVPRLWPLHPIGGKIELAASADGVQHIAANNAGRYDALVHWIVALDVNQLVGLYRKTYPIFQQAYENLGYPGQYFNDRVVAVIDHLLLAPEPVEPLAVHLVRVQGEVPTQSPWLRYEFTDPQWQTSSAGHKLLLRIGPAHRASVKAYLRQLRSRIAS